MADDPNEPELQCFKITAIAHEIREYTVWADGQDEAKQQVFNTRPEYDVVDDVPGSLEIIELWEA